MRNRRAKITELACMLAFCQSAIGGAVASSDDPVKGAPSQGPQLSLTTVDGESVDVTFTSLTANRIEAEINGEARGWSLDDLARITPSGASLEPVEPMRGPDVCEFYLVGGGTIHGKLALEDAAPGAVRTETDSCGRVDLKYAGMVGVRVQAAELPDIEAEFQSRMAERKPGSDAMILMQAGKAVALLGSLERLDGRGWDFRYAGKLRSGTLEHVYGFIFAPPAGKGPGASARVQLTNGDQFGAALVGADADGPAVDSPALGRIALKWKDIAVIDLQSDRVVPVSSLKPEDTRQRSLGGARWLARMDTNVTGGPIRLGPRQFSKGIGVHAYSSLSFALNGEYERFSAVVGIDESMAPNGSAIFRVIVDGKTVYASGTLRGGMKPESIAVSVTGGQRLTLECDPGDDLDISDHGDWANAVLIRVRGKDKP